MSTTKVLAGIGVALAIVSLGIVTYEVTIQREAGRRLAAERSEHQASAARLHALELRSQAAEQELAQLRQTTDAVRAANSVVAQKLAPVAAAPATAPGFDPAESGKAFLAAHPEVKQALVDRSRARIAARFYTLYAELHLASAQITRFEDLLIEQEGLNLSTPETGPLALRPGNGLSRDQVERGVRELLGDDGYRRYQETGRAGAVQQLTSFLASSLYFTSDPLTGQQADDLAQIIQQSELGRKNDGGMRNWEALTEQAQSILSPPQLAALDNLRAQEEFAVAMKRLTGK